MAEETWASSSLANRFADDAYATVKGQVRTRVMHQHLLDNLPDAPARILDVGGGAGHQSLPLAQAGYDVTVLDPSPPMLDKARDRHGLLPPEAQRHVTFLLADGEHAEEAVQGERFDAVMCHGVLGYIEQPEPLIDQLCRCVRPDGIVSIMTGNANASAVQPALERRWVDALSAFDTTTGVGVLGLRGRADTVTGVGELIRRHGVEPVGWYGVWLFVDWLEFCGVALDPTDADQVAAIVAVELEASRRDPYRQLSRVFHLIGRKIAPTP
jgi:SAM-dependent methyltransferase